MKVENPRSALSHEALMNYLDQVDTQLKNMCLASAGLAIGSSSKTKVKIANTVTYLSNGEFKSKTTAEVPFTATTDDIAADADEVQERCYMVVLAADGTPSIVAGDIATGSGNAKWPERPETGTPIGGVRLAVAAGSTPFDATTDELDESHITDTYYNFGYVAPRFDAAQ